MASRQGDMASRPGGHGKWTGGYGKLTRGPWQVEGGGEGGGGGGGGEGVRDARCHAGDEVGSTSGTKPVAWAQGAPPYAVAESSFAVTALRMRSGELALAAAIPPGDRFLPLRTWALKSRHPRGLQPRLRPQFNPCLVFQPSLHSGAAGVLMVSSKMSRKPLMVAHSSASSTPSHNSRS